MKILDHHYHQLMFYLNGNIIEMMIDFYVRKFTEEYQDKEYQSMENREYFYKLFFYVETK